MNRLDTLEKQCKELCAEIEKLKAEKVADEWPKKLDVYWYCDDYGNTAKLIYKNDTAHNFRLASGNCHRTKEEAEAYKAWLTSPRTQARREVEMQQGFSPNGATEIYYFEGKTEEYIGTGVLQSRNSSGGLRFTSKEQAQACIDKLGEEKIKVALGVW